MATIALIRHGITDWNELGKAQGVSDVPLNKLGRQQAFHIGERLLEEGKWDEIISSNLSRAVDTAEIIGRKLNLSVCNFDGRISEMDCGKIEGRTEKERCQKWGSNWREMDLGMERFDEVGRRGMGFLEEVVCKYHSTLVFYKKIC